jgi:alginate O-acetyltransferase complex protein AlgI
VLFNSFPFIVFFIIVTPVFFVIQHRYRWLWLLAASCVFYAFFKWEYIFILLVTIVVDYYAGIKIEESTTKRRKKLFLVLSLIANIGMLCIFKYYNFINENIIALGESLGTTYALPAIDIILPIGLSFHTFQAMSYTIEVYRGNQQAERHFGIYSLYVMFYPQLVAGPIERPQNILRQLHVKTNFSYENTTDGLKLIGWGLFKKIVIADRLAEYVNTLYQNPESYNGVQVIIPLLLFSYQIYCDFSGYSDIALGTAKIMGYNLMVNFNNPYYATSIPEFWTRWHISLSTWFKDYLYIPLGGNRTGMLKWIRNVLIVFAISGLWHGASWNFIIWGVLHALLIIAPVLLFRKFKLPEGYRLIKAARLVFTFLLVSFTWVFFRAETFDKSTIILKNACTGLTENLSWFLTDTAAMVRECIYLGKGQDGFVICSASVLLLEAVQYIKRNKGVFYFFQDRSIPFRWAFYIGLTIWVMVFGVYQSSMDFIYFQF